MKQSYKIKHNRKKERKKLRGRAKYAIPECTYFALPLIENKVINKEKRLVIGYKGINPLRILSPNTVIEFLSKDEVDRQLFRNLKLPEETNKKAKALALNRNIDTVRTLLNHLPYTTLRDAAFNCRVAQGENKLLDNLLISMHENVVVDEFFCEWPVFYYLRDKIDSFVLSTVLVEILHQKAIEESDCKSKRGKISAVDYVSHFQEYDNLIRKIKGQKALETYTAAKSTIDSYKRSLDTLRIQFSEKPLSKKSVNTQILHQKMKHFPTKQNISYLSNLYLNSYNPEIVLGNIPGISIIADAESPAWVPYGMTTYWSYLLSYINQKHFLLKKCEQYKVRRRKFQDHSPGNEFKSIAEKYQSMCKKANALLMEIKERDVYRDPQEFVDIVGLNIEVPPEYIKKNKKSKFNTEYACNKFLFSNLLHQDFFSSVDSTLFELLSNMCDLELLLNLTPEEEPSQEAKSAYIAYDLLLLLLKYDINLNDLWDHVQKKKATADNVDTLIKLLYRFLINIDERIENHVSLCLQGLFESPFKDADFLGKGHGIVEYFYKEFEQFFMENPAKVDSIPKFSYDKNKQLVFVQLLLHGAI